ncbi:MAG: RNA-binding transcriptional accessory protein, partial [Rhodocyclaceae bacterium]|nr:RNA-binding transcriptional accessory protein [Rhodocyclaceae bacterium]
AREAGLAPLAEALLADPTLTPETEAARYLNAEAGITDTKAALDGARQILIEQFSENAALLDALRSLLNERGRIVSAVVEGKETEGAKFRDWFDFSEAVSSIPSHRLLALLRGRNEGMLRLAIELPDPPAAAETGPCESLVARHAGIRDNGRAADRWLMETARWAWSVKIAVHLELELMNTLRERAEEEAIRV